MHLTNVCYNEHKLPFPFYREDCVSAAVPCLLLRIFRYIDFSSFFTVFSTDKNECFCYTFCNVYKVSYIHPLYTKIFLSGEMS
jgi:hypothetical protein